MVIGSSAGATRQAQAGFFHSVRGTKIIAAGRGILAAVSAADGSFSMLNLPPGQYVVEAWHELYGVQIMDVAVGEGETAEVSFTYNAGMAENAEVPLGEPLVLGH